MRIQDILAERLERLIIHRPAEAEISLHSNPSSGEMRALLGRCREVRLVIDEDDTLLAWDAWDATHANVCDAMGISRENPAVLLGVLLNRSFLMLVASSDAGQSTTEAMAGIRASRAFQRATRGLDVLGTDKPDV